MQKHFLGIRKNSSSWKTIPFMRVPDETLATKVHTEISSCCPMKCHNLCAKTKNIRTVQISEAVGHIACLHGLQNWLKMDILICTDPNYVGKRTSQKSTFCVMFILILEERTKITESQCWSLAGKRKSWFWLQAGNECFSSPLHLIG